MVKDEKSERETHIMDLLESIATETGTQMIDVALAWERQKYEDTSLSTVTVIGPRNVRQLDANLSSLNLMLTTNQIGALNEASKFELGSPHEVIAGSQDRIFGRGSGLVEIKSLVR